MHCTCSSAALDKRQQSSKDATHPRCSLGSGLALGVAGGLCAAERDARSRQLLPQLLRARLQQCLSLLHSSVRLSANAMAHQAVLHENDGHAGVGRQLDENQSTQGQGLAPGKGTQGELRGRRCMIYMTSLPAPQPGPPAPAPRSPGRAARARAPPRPPAARRRAARLHPAPRRAPGSCTKIKCKCNRLCCTCAGMAAAKLMRSAI